MGEEFPTSADGRAYCALSVKRWYVVRLEARFNRQRTNVSLFSIFLLGRLYDLGHMLPDVTLW